MVLLGGGGGVVRGRGSEEGKVEGEVEWWGVRVGRVEGGEGEEE